jgi:hypothetical protein
MLYASATSLQLIPFLFLEAELGLGHHQLLPFEIPLYALFSIPAVLGALVGYVIRGSILKDWQAEERNRDQAGLTGGSG